jgi:RHS repeat-associated protein
MKRMTQIGRQRIGDLTWLLVATLLAFVSSAGAQNVNDENAPRTFGTHTELIRDMSVKVQGGEISVFRSWQDYQQSWTFNPQFEALTLSDAKQGEAFDHALPKSINRGSRSNTQVYLGVWRNTPAKSTLTNVPSSVAQAAIINSFQYCSNKGEEAFETIYAAKDGFKWTSGVERNWAQYDWQGVLRSWGKGNFLIGKVLYDPQNRPRGYADTFDTEVITFERDPSGRINKVKDYSGREVAYKYDSQNRIEEVIDLDGVKTRYTYENGHIVLKTIGDKTGAAPGEEVNEETTISMAYSPDGILLSSTNPDGIQTKYQYEYNKNSKLYTTIETVTGNRVTTTTHSVDGRVASISKNGEYVERSFNLCEDIAILDQHNALIYIDRDSFGMISTILRPDGKKISFQYTAQNWSEVLEPWNTVTKPWGITSMTTPDGQTASYDRDAYGNVKTIVVQAANGESHRWSFTYDPYGNPIEERFFAGETPNDTLDSIKKWSYDNYGNVTAFQMGLNGPQWQYKYNAQGQIVTLTAPDSEKFQYVFTPSGKIESFTNPRGYVVTLSYTNRGLPKSVIDAYDVGKEAITTYHYNHRGLPVKITDPFANEWLYEYTGDGRIEAAIDPLGKKIGYTYDPKNRMTSFTDGNGVSVVRQYFDTALSGQAPQTEIPFQPKVLVQYPTYTEEQQYDLLGQLTALRFTPKDGSPGEEAHYEYNLRGDLIGMIRPDGGKVEQGWDLLSRITSIKSPGEGTATYAYSNGERKITYTDGLGQSVVYDFDESNKLTKQTRVEGTQIHYTYDVNGNLETVTGGKGEIVKFTYDKAYETKRVEIFANGAATIPLRTINYTRNIRGDFLDIIDGSTIQHYDRDATGRILTASTTYDAGFVKTHSFTYAANGLPQTQTLLDGTTLSYLWDSANQFEGINIPNKGSIKFGYNSQQWFNPTSITFPGGTKQTFEYDGLGRFKNIRSSDQSENAFLNYTYSYQTGPFFGGLTKNLTTQDGTTAYTYDNAGRLTGVSYPDLSDENYTYDAIGRRQPSSGTPWTYTKGGAVTNTGGIQYTYDANGNRSSKTEGGVTSEYIYDESDKLVRIEKPHGSVLAKYTYDSIGRRLSKEVGGIKSYYYYDDSGLAAELDATGVVKRKYIFAPNSSWTTRPLATEEAGAYHFAHSDRLGTPQKFITSGGTVTWSGKATAFGETVVTTSSIENNLRFPGQYFDSESKLNHNFQRNYDPILGAYLEQDPFGILQTGPNRYFYAAANPVSIYDPTGEHPLLLVLALASAAFTAMDAYDCYQDPCQNLDACAALPFDLLGAGIGAKAAKVAKPLIGPALGNAEKKLYRQGTFPNKALGWKGNQPKGQQWAPEHPLTTPGFAQKYGLPANNSGKPDWIVGGTTKGPYTVQKAPGSYDNPVNKGGGDEFIPSDIHVNWFHMPD